MNYILRPMTLEERLYSYTQSSQIGSQTGNIGHLRADMGSNGTSFYSTWFDCRSDLKTDEFKEEFDDLINSLREEGSPLHNRSALSAYCFAHPEAASEDFQDFFFRADTEDYSYMMRLDPNRGEYNQYCYPYKREWLDHHLQESRKGIRFVDRDYNELFRLRDGAKIRVTFPNGEVDEKSVRYIDSTHFEYGFGALSVLHTMQFAEWMAEAKAIVEPVNGADIVQVQQKKRTDRGR